MDPRFSSDRDADLSLFNSTKDESTINFTLCQILQITRERHSNKPAVIYGDSEVNYGILHDLADRVACLLRKKGVKPGDLVGVALERSADLVSVLIGVLNTGAAYVPIDPGLPSERIQYMLEDARPKVVIVTTTTLHSVAAWEGPCLKLEDKWSSEEQGIDSAELGSKPVLTKSSTGLTEKIWQIWRHVLDHDQFGQEDNFFKIGGDSLRVVRVQKELEKLLGKTVSPAVLFRNYTIKALAENFENYEENSKELNKDSKSKNGDVRVSENIAVIGMACRLPGGISTPEQYWQLLVSNGDVIKEVPKGRWKSEPAEVELQTDANKSYCQQGGFLSDIDSFDAPFFSISPREALSMEPSQYIMLETCWEAFERAGYTNEQISGSKTGVFTGISNMAAHQDNSWTYDKLDGYRGTKSASSVISGRVSYALGLEGPTLTVDTALNSAECLQMAAAVPFQKMQMVQAGAREQ
ncbi:putative secondary metabolism biosynthetic enzyme [Amphichorda felina]